MNQDKPVTLLAFSPARAHQLRAAEAGGREAIPDTPTSGSSPLTGRDRERALVDAWREAHWTLRLTLQEVARDRPDLRIEAQYDATRRCDNLLSDYYQARAEVLARQVRDLVDARTGQSRHAHEDTTSAAASSSSERLTVTERALLARVRELAPEERAAVLRLAATLSARKGTT